MRPLATSELGTTDLNAFNLQSYLVRVSPSASSSPKAGDGEKSKPPAWREIDTAVKGLMSGQKMAEGRLHELQTVLRQLSASAFGPLIGDYYRDRLLPQGMATLRNGVLGYDNQTLSNGTGVAPVQLGTVQETVTAMMDRLAATWINFYRTVLPYLEAIFVSIKTQRLTIRETTLVAFRNHVVLKIPLKEAIEHLKNVPNSHQIDGTISEESGTEFGTESKQNARSGTNCAKGKTGFGNFDVKQRIPGISRTNSGAIQQMLLILQASEFGVRDVSTFPTKDQLELEKLVVLVATPYVGHRGLYVRRTDQPDVPSTYRSNNGRLLSTHQQQATGNSPSSKCYHRVHSFNTISSRLATDTKTALCSNSLPFGAYLPRARVETLADLLRILPPFFGIFRA
ncbi:unnamed protein product [Notodromas monacha]|uniref:Uncharacterized protein n=1 Tax=Notodromas monacha TaxID=399045 RepID=A0A7R9GIK8_9CRUS|nr:unnamed protein product [Notodromas monacha]CAG0922700.1 unnamed protein product [Notodromas monacha]